MVVKHIVFFKVDEDNVKDERMNDVFNMIRDLESLPMVIDLYFGRNYTNRSKGFTHALIASFKSREDERLYQANEQHQAAVAKIKEIVNDVLCIDFEDTESSSLLNTTTLIHGATTIILLGLGFIWGRKSRL